MLFFRNENLFAEAHQAKASFDDDQKNYSRKLFFRTQKTQRRKVFGGIETDVYDLSEYSQITPLLRQLQINQHSMLNSK